MKIQILFDLPDKLLQDTASNAAESLFREPGWGEKKRTGYAMIAEETEKAVAAIDFEPIVKAAIAKIIPGVVEDVVGASLKAMVKAQVKKMKDEGTLL